jgi:hypothetical protein
MALYKDNVGVALEVEVKSTNGGGTCAPLNLGEATVYLLIRKPSSTVLEVEAEVTNPRKGIVQYVTVDGDLDEIGTYRYQVRVEPVSGQVWHSSFGSLEVEEPLTPT